MLLTEKVVVIVLGVVAVVVVQLKFASCMCEILELRLPWMDFTYPQC